MFARKNYPFETSFLKGADPLIGIKFSWIKNFWFLITVAPLFIGEGISREMHEGIQFHFMPRELRCASTFKRRSHWQPISTFLKSSASKSNNM